MHFGSDVDCTVGLAVDIVADLADDIVVDLAVDIESDLVVETVVDLIVVGIEVDLFVDSAFDWVLTEIDSTELIVLDRGFWFDTLIRCDCFDDNNHTSSDRKILCWRCCLLNVKRLK